MTDIITFDYSTIENPKAAVRMRSSADKIRRLVRDGMLAVGQELLYVKRTLRHGQFDAWVEAELRWSESTALNYMRVAEMCGEFDAETKYATVAHLPARLLYELASPSVDAGARQAIIDSNTPVSEEQVRQVLDKSKPRPRAKPEPRATAVAVAPTPKFTTGPREAIEAFATMDRAQREVEAKAKPVLPMINPAIELRNIQRASVNEAEPEQRIVDDDNESIKTISDYFVAGASEFAMRLLDKIEASGEGLGKRAIGEIFVEMIERFRPDTLDLIEIANSFRKACDHLGVVVEGEAAK